MIDRKALNDEEQGGDLKAHFQSPGSFLRRPFLVLDPESEWNDDRANQIGRSRLTGHQHKGRKVERDTPQGDLDCSPKRVSGPLFEHQGAKNQKPQNGSCRNKGGCRCGQMKAGLKVVFEKEDGLQGGCFEKAGKKTGKGGSKENGDAKGLSGEPIGQRDET